MLSQPVFVVVAAAVAAAVGVVVVVVVVVAAADVTSIAGPSASAQICNGWQQ